MSTGIPQKEGLFSHHHHDPALSNSGPGDGKDSSNGNKSSSSGSGSKDAPVLSKVKERIAHPFPHLRAKLKETQLYDIKKHAHHLKHRIGKFGNLANTNHRHDEEHEKATDEKRSRIARSHRFESFAPVREGNELKWYVDGRDYFWAVSVALERARETIYICDWWLSPELFLRRPPHEQQDYRLDKILKRKAEDGVKIYVIVYKEVEAAITCNSRHTKHSLHALCPEGSPGHGNIVCMRHPDHNVLENAGDMTFYWAHHEKFIVIDYDLAFIGGLDLCFGRWDAHQHTMADIHPAGVQNEIFPGQDFNNNRIMDFHSVEDWKSNQLSKAENGRMPWHDVAFGLVGPAVYDIAEHFVLRWNFCKRDKYKRKANYPWLTLEGREGDDEDLVGVQRPKFPEGGYIHHPLSPLSGKNISDRGTVKAQLVRSSADWSSGILTEHSIMNAYCELISQAEHLVYIENQFFITATGDQQAPVSNTIGRAIVDAVVRAGKEKRKLRVVIVIPAIPGFAGDLRQDAATGTRAIMDYQYKSILRGEHSIFEQVKAQGVNPEEHIYIFNLRSYDRLNTTPAVKEAEKKAGVGYVEIQNAEAEEIMGEAENTAVSDKAKDIDKKIRSNSSSSDAAPDAHPSENQAADQNEAKRKFDEQRGDEGFGGDSKEDHSQPTANTIAQNAMLGTKNVSNEPWHDGHDDLERNNIIQEELYIHAKLLIVDDRFVVCGSSNINDRSQIGIHDSELSIVLEDTKKLQSKMNGEPFEANHLAATLRRRLWREHLGLLPPQDLDGSDDPNAQPPGDGANVNDEGDEFEFVADPLDDKLWETWTSQATVNTEIFRDLFHADPDNSIKTFEDYEKFTPNPEEDKDHLPGHIFDKNLPVAEIKKQLDRIKGHLVWMPLDFLCEADMAERGIQVNSFTESVYA